VPTPLHDAAEALHATRTTDPSLGPLGRVLDLADGRLVRDAFDRRHGHARQPSGFESAVAGLEQDLDFMTLEHSEHSPPCPATAGMGF
jgi:hypothetical protein